MFVGRSLGRMDRWLNVLILTVDLVSNMTQVLGPTSLEVNRLEVEAKVTSTYICQASNDEGQVDRAVRIRVAGS